MEKEFTKRDLPLILPQILPLILPLIILGSVFIYKYKNPASKTDLHRERIWDPDPILSYGLHGFCDDVSHHGGFLLV